MFAAQEFDVKSISQSSSVSGASNTLTVSLQPSVTLTAAAGWVITVTGLPTTMGTGSGTLTLDGACAGSFSVSGTPSRVAWNSAAGTLTLTVTTDIATTSACVVTVALVNPTTAHYAGVTPSVVASNTVDLGISSASMTGGPVVVGT